MFTPSVQPTPPSPNTEHSPLQPDLLQCGEIIYIPLAQLQLDPNRPRRVISEIPLIRLAANIMRHGCLQPLLVRPAPSIPTHDTAENQQNNEPAAPRFIIINGERRFHAAEGIRLAHLPCQVRSMSDREALEIQLVDNILREDLDPIERGLALRELYESKNANGQRCAWDDVARSVGIGYGRVAQLVRLGQLPKAIISMVQRGELSSMHAHILARMNEHPQEQLSLAEQSVRRGRRYGLTCSELRQCVQEVLNALNPRYPVEQLEAIAIKLRRMLDTPQAHKTAAAARATLEETARQLGVVLKQITPQRSPAPPPTPPSLHPSTPPATPPSIHPASPEPPTPNNARVGAHPAIQRPVVPIVINSVPTAKSGDENPVSQGEEAEHRPSMSLICVGTARFTRPP